MVRDRDARVLAERSAASDAARAQLEAKADRKRRAVAQELVQELLEEGEVFDTAAVFRPRPLISDDRASSEGETADDPISISPHSPSLWDRLEAADALEATVIETIVSSALEPTQEEQELRDAMERLTVDDILVELVVGAAEEKHATAAAEARDGGAVYRAGYHGRADQPVRLLTGLISLYTNPVSILSVPIQNVL
jgi:hypothetical protein